MEEILLHEEPILDSKPVEMVRPNSSIVIPKKGDAIVEEEAMRKMIDTRKQIENSK